VSESETAIEVAVRRLKPLVGRWKGRGSGDYPTIDAFEFEETLNFELDTSYPMFHYEQRTLLLPEREPSHWESGFIRLMEDGTIEVSNSQDSGRVEVLGGRPEAAGDAAGGFEIVLDSLVLAHDPRLAQTRRVWTLRGDSLRYVTYMATHTTPQPELLQHLEAALERS
jgi:hypothetical protein